MEMVEVSVMGLLKLAMVEVSVMELLKLAMVEVSAVMELLKLEMVDQCSKYYSEKLSYSILSFSRQSILLQLKCI